MDHDEHARHGQPQREHAQGSSREWRAEHGDHGGHDAHGDHSQGQGKGGHGGHGKDHASHHRMMLRDFRRRFIVSIILTVPVLLISPMFKELVGLGDFLRFPGEGYALFAFSSLIYFYGGWPFLKGLFDELRGKQPGMMTLIGLAITVAYVYSSLVVFVLPGKTFFWELATLVDIMLLGHWIEMRSVMSASSALEELARLLPSEAHKLVDNERTEDVSVEDLVSGDRILIKPGEKLPADGEIVEGESSVNEAMLTGEATPVDKKPGDKVIGGSVNGEGSLTVEVRQTGKDSYLAQVIDLVQKAQESKSRSQDTANRAAMWLTFIALAAGGLTMIAWWAFIGREFAFSLERTVTVMVITCPHALGLAVPLVVAVSTSLAAGSGFLIRDRGAFERARNIEAVLFDKTGTLTLGEFRVAETASFGDMDKEEVLRLAASVEAASEHPIARGIMATAEEQNVKTARIEDFQAIKGKGAKARMEDREVAVVSEGYLRERGLKAPDKSMEPLRAGVRTLVFVVVDGQPVGALALADKVRESSKQAVAELKELGVRCIMITGDNGRTAEAVAREIGLDEFFAEVLPDKKAEKVKEVQDRGLTTAMVGDGINDAPALAQADIGIAIGAGTDVAMETADIVLVKSDPRDVVAIIKLAGATRRKMIQNLFWATGYNAFAIPLAAGVLAPWGILLSPAAGAILMSLSTVIVAINARLLRFPR
ncbi:copper-translocating P-type ATPase [Desulfocurvibacter africanus]|uniref:Copper-translocating P-type ATPase n=1 Tax=Desulfocurvibacter africanus subsp. africanus str. Walvis Bay TaxID=690850 RepID=F3YV23_DESAF|nr:copper-translocating P-type ATPase [Desulfocurvibacter africanus]EGJ49273.1 copper-translocating P-type ATPase [Desulfocurvibacter africanus subsp. africanus str. Walvis Bay]